MIEPIVMVYFVTPFYSIQKKSKADDRLKVAVCFVNECCPNNVLESTNGSSNT